MRVLYITPYAPSLIRVRPYQLIRALARAGHEVTLACPHTSGEEALLLGEWQRMGVTVLSFPLSKARSYLNCVRHFPGRMPLQAVYCWDPCLMRGLRELLQWSLFDVIHVEHLRGALYGLGLSESTHSRRDDTRIKRCPMVWDSVDCITHLFRQARSLCSSWRGRVMSAIELARTQKFEVRAASAFDRVLLTSGQDAEALSGMMESATHRRPGHLRVVPNGVDLGYFTPATAPGDGRSIVFTGKMSYHANITACHYLIRSVMPLVWQARPDVCLTVAGKDPPAEIYTLARHANARWGGGTPCVRVTGTVADLRPHLRGAAVAVSAVVYGAGIQNKLLESMACGTASVASPQAISALEAVPGRDLLAAEGRQAFAEAILFLLDHPEKRREIAQNGRLYVERRHSWDCAASQLTEIYAEAAESFGVNSCLQ